MKLALDSISSKYTQGMHSKSTVINLPVKIYVCRNCVVADGLDIVRIPPPPFEKGGGEVNFNYIPRRGESEKLKKGVKVWCRGRAS